MYAGAEKLFRASNNDDVKDFTKMIIKLGSILVACLIFILQIPIITVLFQGYLCNENPKEDYVLTDIECGGFLNTILIFFSTITLIFYLAFLLLKHLLYTSCSFISDIPWSTLDRKLAFVRIAWKLVLSLGFMLGKGGSMRLEINIACFLIGALTSYRVLTTAVIY